MYQTYRVIDVSDIRQVPDSQEVFVYTDSDSFLSIEVLERVPRDDDSDAVKYHFNALAEDNDAINSTITSIQPFKSSNVVAPLAVAGLNEATGSIIMNTPNTEAGDMLPHIILEGRQEVRKFNQPDAVEVEILMALFRIRSHDADVVVSASIPNNAARSIGIKEDFYVLVSSFRIHDYGLFGSH
ncbi:hypothetical protein V8B97DRAFT_1501215 [Scleroderma yunnanense]